MTTLSANEVRTHEEGDFNDLPVIADDIIFDGAAVGDNGSGYSRPLVSADPFQGFAYKKADNTGGSAGDKNVRVRETGIIKLTVVGASSVADQGEPVYATDDNTFTLTSSGASIIGKVARWITSTTCMVYYESVVRKSN